MTKILSNLASAPNASEQPESNTQLTQTSSFLSQHRDKLRDIYKTNIFSTATSKPFFHSDLRARARLTNLSPNTIRTAPPPVSKPENSKTGHVPFVASPGLLALTSLTLFGEAATHYISHDKRTLKILARSAIGGLQMTAGMLGMDYYRSKFKDEASIRSGTMFSGYSLFCLEGLARIIEARKRNLPVTGAIGALAAFFKTSGAMEPLCSNSYAVDAMANLVEMRHGTSEPKEKGFAKALWALGHSMDKRHIAILQVSAASAMAANSARKILAQPAMTAAPAQGTLSNDKFDHQLDNFVAQLEIGKNARAFERLCDIQSPDEFERQFCTFFAHVTQAASQPNPSTTVQKNSSSQDHKNLITQADSCKIIMANDDNQ